MKSKGLGDTIEWVIETTGLSHFKPKNCNCDKRKEMLNKIVPYGNTKKKITELKPAPYNPRKSNKKQEDNLRKSTLSIAM